MARIETITVELGERSYPICIGAGTLGGLGEKLKEMRVGQRIAVITNPVVGKLYQNTVVDALKKAKLQPTVIEIPDGEEHKNLAWVTFLYDRLIDARIERESPLIALGGGVVGDLAGFTAATYLRGIPFVQVPTTLLAQVDSSVGGKTGVNHPSGKNLIGAFYQPKLVWADVHTLATLPRRELLAGLAEVIKYGATLSSPLFDLLERRLDEVLALNDELMIEIVQLCCELKAKVVSEDERETGYRAVLNFGHTLGHAVEMLTEYKRFLHGEAVAIGMAFACKLSAERGHCKPETADRVVALLARAGLPVAIPDEVIGSHLALAVGTDKKTSGGKIKFVCLQDIGRTRFESLTGEEIARHAGHGS
jgi:3-dehydroquinate synthase